MVRLTQRLITTLIVINRTMESHTLEIHPEYLNRENIRFDIFHLRCALTRRLMSHLREYLLRTTPDLINEFSTILGSFFSEYNVLLWNLNKPFTILKVPELLDFI